MAHYGETIDAIFRIISDKLPTQLASDYIHEHVELKMDNIAVTGLECWCLWVEYLWRFGRVPNITFKRTETVVDGFCVKVIGLACGELNGGEKIEKPIAVQFEFRGDKIARIQTTRLNYAVAFGDVIRYRPIFYLVLLRMQIWKKLRK